MLKLPTMLLFITVLLITCGSVAQSTSTRIFIVRHADRETYDDLNALGMERANELKRMLFPAGIDSVFSTNFIRTKKTVAPIAEALRLPVITYDSNPQLLKRILTYSKGRTLLVSGHSNTVSQLVKACGCQPPFENVPDTQFDNLFLVIIQDNNCKLLHMRYGAVTN